MGGARTPIGATGRDIRMEESLRLVFRRDFLF
jgi:hypothetical protein